MPSIVWAVALKPFVALIVFGLVCLPARLWVQSWKDSRLKRILLLRVSSAYDSHRDRSA